MKSDVIVLGGGIAGIVTCLACIQYGLTCILVERSTELGGRVLTIHNGGRVNGSHKRTLSLIQAFGLTLSPCNTIPVGVRAKIDKVLKVAKTMSSEDLRNITYGQLCCRVLGHTLYYHEEFETMNAWDATQMFHRFKNSPSFSCKEGLDEWIRRMECVLYDSGLVTVLKGHSCVDWYRTKLGFCTILKNHENKLMRVYGHAAVSSLPKNDLLAFTKWNMAQRDLLKSVDVRAMDDSMDLRNALLSNMQVVFPEIQLHRDTSIHVWKHGVTSMHVHNALLQPFGKDVPFFMAGEAYSMQQGWIEGAIEMVDEIFPKLTEYLLKHRTDDETRFCYWLRAHNYQILSYELRSLSSRFPRIPWWVEGNRMYVKNYMVATLMDC